MKVALLNTKPTPRSQYMLEAFAVGLATSGDEPIWVRDQADLDRLDAADVGVQLCYPNRHHDGNPLAVFRLAAFDRLASAGKRVLTIDTGFIRNQPDAELALRANGAFKVDLPRSYAAYDSSVYYAIGYDGIKRHADYCNAGVGSDRWDKLGIRLKGWRKDGQHILLIGQPLHGLSTQHVNIFDWYAQVFAHARNINRRVIYRPHPRTATIRHNRARMAKEIARVIEAAGPKTTMRVSKNRLLGDDLDGAWVTVVFTSNAAVESAVKGVPVVACDRGCMAWEVAATSLEDMKKPVMPERQDWLHRLAYAQWNVKEFRSGSCWARYRSHAVKESV